MKAILLALVLAAAASAAVAAQNPTFNGKYKIHTSIAGNDSDMTCTFTQKAADLAGSCQSDQQGAIQLTGKIDGKKANWSYKSDYNGSPLTVRYEAVVDDPAKFSGTTVVEEFGVSGDFTAVLAN